MATLCIAGMVPLCWWPVCWWPVYAHASPPPLPLATTPPPDLGDAPWEHSASNRCHGDIPPSSVRGSVRPSIAPSVRPRAGTSRPSARSFRLVPSRSPHPNGCRPRNGAPLCTEAQRALASARPPASRLPQAAALRRPPLLPSSLLAHAPAQPHDVVGGHVLGVGSASPPLASHTLASHTAHVHSTHLAV